MEILEVSTSSYEGLIHAPYHIFGSATFNELNKGKCDKVYYLLFNEAKSRLGIIGGSIGNVFNSPFSAPFGGFVFLSEDIRLKYIEEAIDLLKNWAVEKGFTTINITLPPSIYGDDFITKQTNCLFRKGFAIAKIDLNYSINLNDFDEKYIDRIWYNARKNLRIALNTDLYFVKCKSDVEKRLAYNIIQKNRKERGYILRMSWQQIVDTIQIIPADFFMVFNGNQIPIASAIVFNINPVIVQVVYWGDLTKFNRLKTMNFLSFKVFDYYKSMGKKIIDIGPSTENSLPNYGLCEFKESIGCSICTKLTFSIQVL
jgi:hypothetical protein